MTSLLSYLLSTKEHAIVYPENADGTDLIKVDAYCDASFNSPNENLTKKKTQSRAGYIVLVNGCLVKWYSKLIRLTAQSTEEAKVIAANELVRYLKWLIGILNEMNIPFLKPRIFCDNANAVNWIKTRAVTDRTKHFETKLNLCRDSYERGEITIEHIKGTENPADLMTKQLNWNTIEKHCMQMGLMTLFLEASTTTSGGVSEAMTHVPDK